MDKGLKRAIEAAGGIRELAKKLGIARQSIEGWKRIPDKHLLEIERLVDVDRELLRPDLYRREKKR